jgi:PIN domain nuclease of toxin-antitoxin system
MVRPSALRLLLDTHVWLWQLLEPERLSRRASAVIEDAEAEIHLSPLSVWEALLLADKGRLQLEPDGPVWVRKALEKSPLLIAELTHEVAIRSRDLPGFESRDPVDRFLAASCLVLGMTLVTRDSAMRKYRPLQTIW